MRQINNGFAPYYYLTEQGQIYNSELKRICYKGKTKVQLRTIDGKRKTTNIKDLYMLVYNKIYCIDNIKNLPKEEWKVIDNTNGYYLVSNCGRVKSFKGYEAKLLSQRIHNKKYYRTDIVVDGLERSMLVHKLVAMTFLINDKGQDAEIHHKDFNSFNNNVDNLQYLTVAEHRKIHNEHRKGEKENGAKGKES